RQKMDPFLVGEPMKTDYELGKKVHEHLVEVGVETPFFDNGLGPTEKKELIEGHVYSIMNALGLVMTDDSLVETPKRVAKMYVDEIFKGLDYQNFPKCTTVENKMGYDEMVVERCTIKSSCEHHLVYFGTAHNPDRLGCYVAYMPGKKVLGL